MIYYVALPFTPEEGGGLAPGQAIECPSGAAAIRRAEAIRGMKPMRSRGFLPQRGSESRGIRRCYNSEILWRGAGRL